MSHSHARVRCSPPPSKRQSAAGVPLDENMSSLGSANTSAQVAAALKSAASDCKRNGLEVIVHPRFRRQLEEEPAVFCPLDWLPDEVISNVLVHLVSARLHPRTHHHRTPPNHEPSASPRGPTKTPCSARTFAPHQHIPNKTTPPSHPITPISTFPSTHRTAATSRASASSTGGLDGCARTTRSGRSSAPGTLTFAPRDTTHPNAAGAHCTRSTTTSCTRCSGTAGGNPRGSGAPTGSGAAWAPSRRAGRAVCPYPSAPRERMTVYPPVYDCVPTCTNDDVCVTRRAIRVL